MAPSLCPAQAGSVAARSHAPGEGEETGRSSLFLRDEGELVGTSPLSQDLQSIPHLPPLT